jgi:hypothetical protein
MGPAVFYSGSHSPAIQDLLSVPELPLAFLTSGSACLWPSDEGLNLLLDLIDEWLSPRDGLTARRSLGRRAVARPPATAGFRETGRVLGLLRVRTLRVCPATWEPHRLMPVGCPPAIGREPARLHRLRCSRCSGIPTASR